MLAIALVFGALAVLAPVRAASTDGGRELFERGTTGGQSLSARTGADRSWVLRGATVACANCHGLAGTGGGEGYLRAPDLRWPQWSSPDPRQHAAARERLRRALRQGIGGDGRTLGAAMPRFDLDDASLDALAGHLQRLATERTPGSRPRLAVMQLDDGQQGPTESELGPALRACLRQRLGDRAEVEFVMVASPAEAQAQWRQWQQRSEVMAVLAPPWRGWRPPAPAEGTVALAALFPLVADPETGRVQSVQWLFGGVEARAVALVQAWLQQPQAQSATLPVWVGEGALAPAAPGDARAHGTGSEARYRPDAGLAGAGLAPAAHWRSWSLARCAATAWRRLVVAATWGDSFARARGALVGGCAVCRPSAAITRPTLGRCHMPHGSGRDRRPARLVA
ncbi:MAG: c-type cytochrome [Piscinibacter sp.]|nr:c-type cytochrome [Piscinibacter sp.]